MAMLWLLLKLLCQPGENRHACSSHGFSSLLVHALPTLGSANSVNNKTIGISNTRVLCVKSKCEDRFTA